ncbi:MAG: hypothetical protein E7298_14240 [Lachnospiraceae bacterium]|nr:hypothetical protein [Lachnospiraceae bacterium]
MTDMKQRILSIMIAAILLLSVSVPALAAPPSTPPGGSGGGNNNSSVSWSGATTITSGETQTGKSYSSTSADENALLIDTSSSVTITDPTVTKTGGTSASDNYSFYGINSGIMVKGGASVTITGGTITTDAAGANGVFSYGANSGSTNAAGDGTTVNISDTVITTTGNGSGGIMTTYGGTTNAKNLTVTTSGGSSAPIRTDRGGGWVNVDGGTYTSSGLGSPAIYSTAEVSVANATLVSNKSEGVCIEGTGSIELTDCDLTATNNALNGNATFYDTIMIYQSMSGDADSGSSHFTMTGGTLTSNNGHVFHVTNTNAVITLSGVEIVNNDSANVLLSVCDDGWSGGSNIATLNADAQTLSGAILVGSDSTLTLNLSGGSVFTGTVNGSITNGKGSTVSTSVGTVKVTLDSTSKWVLTGDTYITGFSGNAENVITNGYTLYVNGTALTGTTETDGTDDGTDQGVTFTDVASNDWYYTYVTALANTGVIDGMGDGTFNPNGTLTWAQAMKLLLCAHGDLENVTGSAWATTSMSKAAELGLCNTNQDGSAEISRLAFCQAAAKLFSVSGTADAFPDCEDVSVLALSAAGVINGYPDGSFGPEKTLTRAEISKVIYLLMEL